MEDNKPEVTIEEPVDAEVLELEGGVIEAIEAESVRIQYGGANQITASNVDVAQGGVLALKAETANLKHSAGIFVEAEEVLSDHSTNVVILGEDVQIKGSRVGVSVACRAEISDSSTVFLFAREVDGTVETVLDQRTAAAFGAAAGIVFGFVYLLSRKFSGRR